MKSKKDATTNRIGPGLKVKSINMDDVKKLDKDKILSGQFEIGQDSPQIDDRKVELDLGDN